MEISTAPNWAYLPILIRVSLSLATGLFVGMERERRGKEAGMRTFAFAALLGCMGGLLGTPYALICLALLGVLIVFLNWQRLATNQTAELTTSVALLVTGMMGILCGQGHTFTPVMIGVAAAALLAWKERMTHFSLGLTEAELRAAILLSLITFVIYPVLPTQALDPYGLIEPRATWVTVILIAAIAFVNYIFLKVYGTRGATIAGFLSGLVNSTLAVTEVVLRVKEVGASMNDVAYEGVILATAAMLLRNSVVLGILSPAALAAGAAPLLLMLAGCGVIAYVSRRKTRCCCTGNCADADGESLPPTLRLESPFSLQSALKFGIVFLALHAAGTLAQRWIGEAGFYGVSGVGGLISSASSVASAATLSAKGQISATVAANGAVLASLTSALVSLPLVYRLSGQRSLSLRLTRALAIVTALGIVGIALQFAFEHLILHR